MTRLIPLQGVENFRDFGDYAAGAGRLKKGVLFRAAHQAEATDEDLSHLSSLGIATLVDLRRPNERERAPSRRWDGFSASVIENDLGATGEDPWHTFLKESDLSEASIHAYMDEYYRRAPFKARHLDLFSRYFQAVAKGEGAVLIHCAAGKDRTGFLAALTHHLLGVHHDDLIEDYLLTNTAVDLVGRAPAIARRLHEMTGRVASDDAVVAFLGVEAAYLDAAFAEVEARYGSLDAYLEQALGVDAALRARIEARLSA